MSGSKSRQKYQRYLRTQFVLAYSTPLKICPSVTYIASDEELVHGPLHLVRLNLFGSLSKKAAVADRAVVYICTRTVVT